MTRIRRDIARSGIAAGLLLALVLAVSVSAASGYEGEDEAEREASAPKLWKILQQEQPVPTPVVILSSRHDTSPPLRTIAPVFPGAEKQEAPENPARQVAPVTMPDAFDPFLQQAAPQGPMPAVSAGFDGVNNRNGVLPPDTNGDVGLNQYVQTVNLSFAVYSKTGAVLLTPRNTNTVFSGFGGPCESTNHGDPIVQYDQLADRWLISQFSVNGPYYQCVAVSTTGDATGSWYRYEFQISTTRMNDYPKFGVWPDGYYASFNDFAGGVSFAGATVVAFDRDKMLLGQAATAVKFVLGTAFYSLLPSDLDGSTLPPAGAPDSFVQMDDNFWGYPQDQLEVWRFHVDWATPGNSTFTQQPNLATASFAQMTADIPQPTTITRLDTLTDRLMYRLAYRNFGTHEAMVVNHTVSVSSRAGVRWYELRRTGGNWSINQQGTYAPADGMHRWMGSVALDHAGNLALGMSAGSSTVYPSIYYAGRLAGDPAGTLTMESTMTTGAGSQTHAAGRWGDYSSISVDPTDDCTFWYTTEYLSVTGSAPWKTRIGAFRYPSCTSGPPPPAPTITSFTPTSGPVGTGVTITGTDLTGATSVRFNGTAASYAVNSSTQITATVPGAATTGQISVTTAGGTATSSTSFTVTQSQVGPPTITGFTPTKGTPLTIVTITGTNFVNVSSVSLGFLASTFTVLSPTRIQAWVPNANPGMAKWRVTTAKGTALSPGFFTVTAPGPPTITGFTPTIGPPGTVVTITGTNFVNVSSVTLGFQPCQFTVISATELRVTVFAAAPPGMARWRIITPKGTATSTGLFTVT